MLGAELRRLRKQADLTQEALAFRAGLHPVTISRLENDQLHPTFEVFLHLCAALGVPASEVAGKMERLYRRKGLLPRTLK